jgi:CO/xanthine dehydrogenase Mo-binding subunit
MTAKTSSPAVNRYFGAPVTRNEDPALLTGRALFVDDLVLAEMWHAALLRSPHAHARIESVDVTAAKARDGVIAVYTAEDLGDFWQSAHPSAARQGQGALRRGAGRHGRRREPLCRRGCAG